MTMTEYINNGYTVVPPGGYDATLDCASDVLANLAGVISDCTAAVGSVCGSLRLLFLVPGFVVSAEDVAADVAAGGNSLTVGDQIYILEEVTDSVTGASVFFDYGTVGLGALSWPKFTGFGVVPVPPEIPEMIFLGSAPPTASTSSAADDVLRTEPEAAANTVIQVEQAANRAAIRAYEQQLIGAVPYVVLVTDFPRH